VSALLVGTNPWLAAGQGMLKILGGWRAAIFFAIAVAFGATLAVQSARLSSRTAERDTLQAQAATWQQANASNVQAIDDLKRANARWSSLAKDGQTQAAKAVAAVASERDALAKELDNSRRARSELYRENPDAAAWGRTAVPDSLSRQLRE
jgi:type IV secretory pathway TrbL component